MSDYDYYYDCNGPTYDFPSSQELNEWFGDDDDYNNDDTYYGDDDHGYDYTYYNNGDEEFADAIDTAVPEAPPSDDHPTVAQE